MSFSKQDNNEKTGNRSRRTSAIALYSTTEDILSPRTQKQIVKANRASIGLSPDLYHQSSRRHSAVSSIHGISTPTQNSSDGGDDDGDLFLTKTDSGGTTLAVENKNTAPFSFPPTYSMISTIPESLCSTIDQKPLPDISIHDIRMEGLIAILKSKVPLGFYLYYLLQEYNSENLVEQYENTKYPTPEDRHDAAQQIYRTFITKNSPLEVNLEDRIHKIVLKGLQEKKCRRIVFETAKRHVHGLLGLSYHRFVKSSLWDFMLVQCGSRTVYYDERARITITDKLLSYTHHQEALQHFDCHPLLVSGGSHVSADFPCDTINNLIRDFCQTHLAAQPSYQHRFLPWGQSRSPILCKSTSASTRTTSRMRRKSSNAIKRTGGIRLDFFSKKLSSAF